MPYIFFTGEVQLASARAPRQTGIIVCIQITKVNSRIHIYVHRRGNYLHLRLENTFFVHRDSLHLSWRSCADQPRKFKELCVRTRVAKSPSKNTSRSSTAFNRRVRWAAGWWSCEKVQLNSSQAAAQQQLSQQLSCAGAQAGTQAGGRLGAGTGSRSWSAVSVVVARARRERQNTQHAVIYTRPRPHTPDIYIYIHIHISPRLSRSPSTFFLSRILARSIRRFIALAKTECAGAEQQWDTPSGARRIWREYK